MQNHDFLQHPLGSSILTIFDFKMLIFQPQDRTRISAKIRLNPCRTASSAKKPPRNHPRGLKRPQRLPKVPPKTPQEPAQTLQKPAQSLPTEAKRPRKRHLAPRSVFQNRGLCQNAGKGTCTMTVFVTAVVHHSRNRISGFAL